VQRPLQLVSASSVSVLVILPRMLAIVARFVCMALVP